MTKDLVEGREFNDGALVTEYVGKFPGSFVIEPDDGVKWSRGDQISFVVTAVVGKRGFSDSKKTEGQVRTNDLDILDVTPIDLAKAQWLYDQIDKKVLGINEGFAQPSPVSAPAALEL